MFCYLLLLFSLLDIWNQLFYSLFKFIWFIIRLIIWFVFCSPTMRVWCPVVGWLEKICCVKTVGEIQRFCTTLCSGFVETSLSKIIFLVPLLFTQLLPMSTLIFGLSYLLYFWKLLNTCNKYVAFGIKLYGQNLHSSLYSQFFVRKFLQGLNDLLCISFL